MIQVLRAYRYTLVNTENEFVYSAIVFAENIMDAAVFAQRENVNNWIDCRVQDVGEGDAL